MASSVEPLLSGPERAEEGQAEGRPVSASAPMHGDHGCGHEHFSHRSPWLRAALLGAQDGLVSVSSLMIGVSAVKEDGGNMLVSGLAGLVAGACSMAIGEYVSVYGQRDAEEADILTEAAEHGKGPEAVARELEELTQIYVSRGLSYSLAKQVAVELSAVDPVLAHARDELGLDVEAMANPGQAAVASAAAFTGGGVVPLLAAALTPVPALRIQAVLAVSIVMFVLCGGLGAWLGGAKVVRASARTTVGGIISIAITYAVMAAFGEAL